MKSLTFCELKRLKSEMSYEMGGTPYISKETSERSLMEDSPPVLRINDESEIFTGGTRFSINLDVASHHAHTYKINFFSHTTYMVLRVIFICYVHTARIGDICRVFICVSSVK
jgi:hypothetical protein